MNATFGQNVIEIPLSEIDADQPKQIKFNERVFAIYKIDDTYYAVDDVCTHEFAYLSEGYYEDGIIECPLHQARFDVRTGATLGPPASACLQTYPIEVRGDVVRVVVPDKDTEKCSGDAA
jgi:nitrite reductase/ring-hydroxylating ferredoxin subunit